MPDLVIGARRSAPRPWRAGVIAVALLGGLLLLYQWVPQTLASKGGLPLGLAVLGTVLLSLWEATGLWLVALGSRWAFRRLGALGLRRDPPRPGPGSLVTVGTGV